MKNKIVLSLHSKKEAEFIKKEIIKLLTEYRQKGDSMKQKKYTDRDILFAVHSYISGDSPSQIKKEFGMTRQYLNLCLKKLGVEPREEKHNWEWIKANLQPKPFDETKEVA